MYLPLRKVEGVNIPSPVVPGPVSNRSPQPLVSHYRKRSVHLSDIFQQEVVTRVYHPSCFKLRSQPLMTQLIKGR